MYSSYVVPVAKSNTLWERKFPCNELPVEWVDVQRDMRRFAKRCGIIRKCYGKGRGRKHVVSLPENVLARLQANGNVFEKRLTKLKLKIA